MRAVVNRNQEIPHAGPFSGFFFFFILLITFIDLVWSDPENIEGIQLSPRGAGYLFGAIPVNNVLNFFFIFIFIVL